MAAILCQAGLFLTLAATGVTALLVAAPTAFDAVRLIGAAVLVALGLRAWRRAGDPMPNTPPPAHGIFLRAFLIATVNAKSVAGYLAAFSQFVSTEVPIAQQMIAIGPTA